MPTAGFVYKLVARANSSGDWIDAEKLSVGKRSPGGRKHAARRIVDGMASAEVVRRGAGRAGDERALQVPLVRGGEAGERSSVEEARVRCRASVAELPVEAARLSPGDPVIQTVYESEAS